MSRSTELARLVLLAACSFGAVGFAWSADRAAPTRQALEGIGRAATPAEIRAWDIDVRPDFKGLPKGSGTVKQGQTVWEGKCASCHGTFGESNEVFTPLVGGTTKEDVKTGHVAALKDNSFPQRTMMMKVSTVSTLWDYIHRAMPWNAPKTLTPDEVYSSVAYLLNLADVVPSDFTLSNKNIAEVQARMPNRNGMTLDPGLWNVHGKPDVRSVACMKNCPVGDKIASVMPDFARGSNGNPADQTRLVGPTVGLNVTASGKVVAARQSAAPAPAAVTAASAKPVESALITSYGCVACHGVANKIVGPAFAAIGEKYKAKSDAEIYLIGKIKAGGAGVWGAVPMPPQPQVKDADLKTIAQWILTIGK